MDLQKLEQYVSSGKVSKRSHPTLPLNIYTYSKLTEISGEWDEITTRCRGLILDNEGNVVGDCWRKFFNIEQTNAAHAKLFARPEYGYKEIKHKGTIYKIPDVDYVAYEKMDGSIIFGANYKGKKCPCFKGFI